MQMRVLNRWHLSFEPLCANISSSISKMRFTTARKITAQSKPTSCRDATVPIWCLWRSFGLWKPPWAKGIFVSLPWVGWAAESTHTCASNIMQVHVCGGQGIEVRLGFTVAEPILSPVPIHPPPPPFVTLFCLPPASLPHLHTLFTASGGNLCLELAACYLQQQWPGHVLHNVHPSVNQQVLF